MEIKGKIAVVTGASRGIGAATAQALGKAGAKVVLVARSKVELDSVAGQIRKAGGEAFVFPSDLVDGIATVKVCSDILETVGVPALLINNAGAGRWLFVEETPVGEEEMMIALPYLAAFRMTRGFLPAMLQQGHGMILNVNSPVSVLPWSGATGYAGSRWALRGFSESLRADLRGTGLVVSEVVLGEVDSNYFEANPGAHERLPKISKLLPVLTPEQAAHYILKAVKGNKRRFTAPFLLSLTRFFAWLTPGLTRWIVQSGDLKHPQAK